MHFSYLKRRPLIFWKEVLSEIDDVPIKMYAGGGNSDITDIRYTQVHDIEIAYSKLYKKEEVSDSLFKIYN